MESKSYGDHSRSIHSVAWSCNGKYIATGSPDKTCQIYVSDTQILKLCDLKGHSNAIHQLVWSPVDPNILATACIDKSVRIWDARSGKSINIIQTRDENTSISWSPSNNYISVSSTSDRISIIDVRKYTIPSNGDHHTAFSVAEMEFNQSGQLLLLTTSNGTVEFMKMPTFQRLHNIQSHMGSCYCIKFDPSYKFIATGGADALVSIWDASELVCIHSLQRFDTPIHSIGFSHDSRYLAVGSEEKFIDIYNVNDGSVAHTITTSASTNSIAWNPKEMLLAYAVDDKDQYKDCYTGRFHIVGFNS